MSSTNRLLLVVTDDDFLETTQPIWCEASLQRAIDACRDQRRATYLKLETIRAGSPSLLRGGRSIVSGPRRLIGLICDDQRRVISCFVGVPSTRQLLGFSEDADELSVLMALENAAAADTDADENTDIATSLGKAVRERATNRVTRHYQPLLPKLDSSLSIDDAANLLAEALSNDIKERFLFDSPIESERWISAQQHAEARRHWCEAMLIGFVGKPVDEIWPQLASSVWGAAPWYRSGTVQQFATDCSETLQQHGLAFELDLENRYLQSDSITGRVGSTFAAIDIPETKREASLAKTLQTAQVKTCVLCELAVLLKKLNQPPVSLRNPRTQATRWIVLKSPDSEPVILPNNAENRLMDLIRSLQP